MNLEKITKALAVTAEAMGQEISTGALVLMAKRLEPFGEKAAMMAIERVQTHCRRLTLADLIESAQGNDGRPTADEAWSIAIKSMDESITVITNDEILNAYGIAKDIYDAGDEVGARMAFRAAYSRTVEQNRANGISYKWIASVGTDKVLAEDVISAAVTQGKLTQDYAVRVLPYKPEQNNENAVLALTGNLAMIKNMTATPQEKELAKANIEKIKLMLISK